MEFNSDQTGLYAYEYDNSGNVGYIKDLVQNKEYRYEYDSLDFRKFIERNIESLWKIKNMGSIGKVDI